MNANIGQNIRKLTYLIIIFFIVLSGGLVYWQAVVAAQVAANNHNSRHCLPDSAPLRGRIFDRNGVLLADLEPIDPNHPPLIGICGYQRHYFLSKYPSLAGLIGYYIGPGFSSSGIELAYNDYLMGKVGLTELNNTMNGLLHRAPVGDDIYLTIDTRIQAKVEQAFDHNVPPPDGVNVFASNRGSVVVTDPHTGEILAMLSRPTFDPNRIAAGDLTYFSQLQHDPAQPLLERPIQATYVPGSTYKTMTLVAALDSGAFRLDDALFYNDHLPEHFQAIGPVTLGTGDQKEVFGPVGNNICCYTFRFPISLRYGYVHSDNIIYAQTGVKTGLGTWLNYNERFFVGKQIPLDNLPVTVSTVTPRGKPLTVMGMAEDAFGQGVDAVTPLQMSLLDNAIANNGVLMRPGIIEKIMDPNGSVIQPFNAQQLGTPMSQQTASQVRDAMYGVVQCGSGRFANPNPLLYTSPWAIIGKTGTGEVGGGRPAQAWLITQAPYKNDAHRLTIVAMKENAGEGGSVNGQMVTDIYNTIFSSILKAPQEPPPDPNYCASTGLLQ